LLCGGLLRGNEQDMPKRCGEAPLRINAQTAIRF
jgi:hypothetical protein